MFRRCLQQLCTRATAPQPLRGLAGHAENTNTFIREVRTSGPEVAKLCRG